MTQITGKGYEYNTETRIVTFRNIACFDCKGKIASCKTCNGSGEIFPNMTTRLDFSKLIRYIKIKTMQGINRYSIRDFEAVMRIANKSARRVAKQAKVGDFLTSDYKLVESGIFKLGSEGYIVFSNQAYSRRNK